MQKYDVVIIGGGLAGLTAAIELSGSAKVLLIEKNQYPQHKVCGEYISKEITPFLDMWGISLNSVHALHIDRLTLSTVDGDSLRCNLPLGGYGISRYALDKLFYEKATEHGVEFRFDSAEHISFKDDQFTVHLKCGDRFVAPIVIGAYGKRNSLDRKLSRKFIEDRSSWLAVKGHYQLDYFPEDQVALHNFNGGYAGLSKVESGLVNFCYLANYQSFKKERSVKNFNKYVVSENPYLASFLEKARPQFKENLSIAQISFQRKELIKDHIIMCGDSAGLIYPLCGNGMAMAIQGAVIASEVIREYLINENYSRVALEREYSYRWNHSFRKRLNWSRRLQYIMLNQHLSSLALKSLAFFPKATKLLIKTTHGQPVAEM